MQGESTTFRHARRVVLGRDGGKCVYCGSIATAVDHVVPRCRGGGDGTDNLVACCKRCNSRLGGLAFVSVEEKRAYLTKPIEAVRLVSRRLAIPFCAECDQRIGGQDGSTALLCARCANTPVPAPPPQIGHCRICGSVFTLQPYGFRAYCSRACKNRRKEALRGNAMRSVPFVAPRP